MNRHARFNWIVFQTVNLIIGSALVFAQQGALKKPGLITSVGQSSDIAIVKALLNTKLKLDLEVKPVAQPADLANAKTVLIVVGSSTKGLGAAGLNVDQEMERTRTLMKAAKENGIRVVILHVGGEARRGKTTNDFLEIVVPQSNHVIVVASGNKDRLFNTLTAKAGIPLTEVASLAAAGDAVKSLFGD